MEDTDMLFTVFIPLLLLPLTAFGSPWPPGDCSEPAEVQNGSWMCCTERCRLVCDYGFIATNRTLFECGETEVASVASCVETMAFVVGGEGSLKIESDVEIVTERLALSERSVAPFPSPVAAAISFWHGGRVHVCGGHASYPTESTGGIFETPPPNTESTAACWTYDACADEWTESGAMGSARSYAAIAHDIEGKPFVTGGVDDGEVTVSAEILEEGNLWLPYDNATLTEPKFAHCTVNTPTKIQLTAGGQGYKKSEVIDLKTMEHNFQFLHHKRYSHACTAFTDKEGTYIGLVAGGMNGETLHRETTIDTVEIWNSERDEWTEGRLLEETRAGATFATLNGKPHLIGGGGIFLLASNILVYNTDNGTWSKSESVDLKKQRAYHTSTEVPVTMFDMC